MTKNEGISAATLKVLEEEAINNFKVFNSLKGEHFAELSKKVKLGQHASLQRVWDNQVT